MLHTKPLLSMTWASASLANATAGTVIGAPVSKALGRVASADYYHARISCKDLMQGSQPFPTPALLYTATARHLPRSHSSHSHRQAGTQLSHPTGQHQLAQEYKVRPWNPHTTTAKWSSKGREHSTAGYSQGSSTRLQGGIHRKPVHEKLDP